MIFLSLSLFSHFMRLLMYNLYVYFCSREVRYMFYWCAKWDLLIGSYLLMLVKALQVTSRKQCINSYAKEKNGAHTHETLYVYNNLTAVVTRRVCWNVHVFCNVKYSELNAMCFLIALYLILFTTLVNFTLLK